MLEESGRCRCLNNLAWINPREATSGTITGEYGTLPTNINTLESNFNNNFLRTVSFVSISMNQVEESILKQDGPERIQSDYER